jgi:hypothetical protein
VACPPMQIQREAIQKEKIRGPSAEPALSEVEGLGMTEKRNGGGIWNLDPHPTLDDSRRPRPVRAVPRARGEEKDPGFLDFARDDTSKKASDPSCHSERKLL